MTVLVLPKNMAFRLLQMAVLNIQAISLKPLLQVLMLLCLEVFLQVWLKVLVRGKFIKEDSIKYIVAWVLLVQWKLDQKIGRASCRERVEISIGDWSSDVCSSDLMAFRLLQMAVLNIQAISLKPLLQVLMLLCLEVFLQVWLKVLVRGKFIKEDSIKYIVAWVLLVQWKLDQ